MNLQLDLKELLNSFSANSNQDKIHENVLELFQRDQQYSSITQNVCSSYPKSIIVPKQNKYKFDQSVTRVRDRFIVPVIFCKDYTIFRSSTLSNELSASSQLALKFTLDNPWTVLKEGRALEINQMEEYRISTIFDLMVENEKSKYGLNVTTSEKIIEEYKVFQIFSIPYPGVEFFKHAAKCNDLSSFYPNWDLHSTESPAFTDFKEWDLVTITKNYLEFMLLNNETKLIHCISGWDRTPLFISLMRLALWSKGRIHQTLDPREILYLTIAYDWMLFGHLLEQRRKSGDDIFHFQFRFLRHLNDPKLDKVADLFDSVYVPVRTKYFYEFWK